MKRTLQIGAIVVAAALGFGTATVVDDAGVPFGSPEPTPTPTVSPTPEPPAWTGPCARRRAPYKVEVLYAHFGDDERQWDPNKGRVIVRPVDELVFQGARKIIRKSVSKINERFHEETGRDIKWACGGKVLRVTNIQLEHFGSPWQSFKQTLRDRGLADPLRTYLGFMPITLHELCGQSTVGDGEYNDPGYSVVGWNDGRPSCWRDSTPLHELFHAFGAEHVDDDKTDLMHPFWDSWGIDPGDFDYYSPTYKCEPGRTCFPNTYNAPYLTRTP